MTNSLTPVRVNLEKHSLSLLGIIIRESFTYYPFRCEGAWRS